MCVPLASVAHAQTIPLDCPTAPGWRPQFAGGVLQIGPGPGELTTPLPPMAPCELMKFRLTATVAGQGMPNAVPVQITTYNASGEILDDHSLWCWLVGGCTVDMPQAWSWAGTPLPATRGPKGRPTAIKVKMLGWNTTAMLTYTLDVEYQSRPQHNWGGDATSNAPLLTNSPAVVRGSLHWREHAQGQYYKVRIAPGGTLTVAGTAAVTCAPCNGTGGLFLDAHDQNGVFLKNLGAASYGSSASSTFVPTSPPLTNATGTAVEYLLRLHTTTQPVPTLHNFQLTLTWTEATGPKLTLFLDRDPQTPGSPEYDSAKLFDADHLSDHAGYIPGARRSGASEVITDTQGQALTLIAAYVDNGVIVPPPPHTPGTVTFALAQTSAFRGYAMNAGASTSADFSLAATAAAFGADHTARTTLLCHDYGGFTTVSAAVGAAAVPGLRVPVDANSNWLPDAGWSLYEGGQQYGQVSPGDSQNLQRAEDSDDDPSDVPLSDGAIVGDGLIAFEEFRGYMAKGEHRRTNPLRKDLFIDSDVDFNIGDALYLPITKHWVSPAELSTSAPAPCPGTPSEGDGLREVNFNYCNHASGQAQMGRVPQDGLIVRALFPVTMDLGLTHCPPPAQCSPNQVGLNNIRIYLDNIRLGSPTHYDAVTADPIDPDAIRATIGHEIGHGVGIPHRLSSPPSLMNEAYFWGAPWTPASIPHTYITTDTAQIRISPR